MKIVEEGTVPIRNITLTSRQDAFVERMVRTGEYQSASEVVRDALRTLQQRRRADALRLRALRLQIEAGAEALERGEFTEVDEADLEAYLDGLPGELSGAAR